jgi:hypothetical protein
MHALAKRSPSQLAVRAEISVLENTLREEINSGRVRQTIVDCKEDPDQADHYYGEGVYARSLLIPAGTCVIGHIHKQDRICIIAQGKCTFVDEFHKETVEAPYVGEFKAGSKTAVYAHTDTLWVACLGTDSKDAGVIIDDLVETDHEGYQKYLANLEEK